MKPTPRDSSSSSRSRISLLAAGIACAAALLFPATSRAQAFGFGAPAALNSNAATDAGGDLLPHLATDGAGNWVAVWRSDESLGGTIGSDIDILVARSTDNGATWTAPAALNSNAGADSGTDTTPKLATDGAGNRVAVWSSDDDLGGTIGTDSDILVAHSTDNGATWTALATLNDNAATDAGDDVQPELATDGAGNWLAVWRSTDDLGGTIGADFDILFARSMDNGATWSAPAAVSNTATADTASDTSPHVITDGAGNWIAVWVSSDSLGGTIGGDPDVVYCRSTDNGATWSPLAALNSNAAASAAAEFTPRLATDGAGEWFAVWTSNDTVGGTVGADLDVFVARSTDNGATWSSLALLNSNAATDAGGDNNPQLTTDGAGNWIAVWNSGESLGGTIGADQDILFTTSNDVPVELSGFGLE